MCWLKSMSAQRRYSWMYGSGMDVIYKSPADRARQALLAILPVVLIGAVGCGGSSTASCQNVSCFPCPPGGVVVIVTDLNTGSAIGGVSIEGFTCTIWFQGVYTLCQAPFRSGTAVYDVTIDATGYAPYVLHVVEDSTPTPGSACCGPCPATTSYTVKLTPYVGPASLMRPAGN